MGYRRDPDDLEHIVSLLEFEGDPHIVELRRQAREAARLADEAHEEMVAFADKVLGYWFEMVAKVRQFESAGKFCKSAAYVAGFERCESEEFFPQALQEINAEHARTDRTEQDLRILAYIRARRMQEDARMAQADDDDDESGGESSGGGGSNDIQGA